MSLFNRRDQQQQQKNTFTKLQKSNRNFYGVIITPKME